DGVHGNELWKSDGTAVGTVLVKDIFPGTSFFGIPNSSDPGNLTAVGNTLFFSAGDGINGRELWKSDGTEAGTVLVKDIEPGFGGSGPGNFTAVGNTLYFTARTSANGMELWKSDGTATGTVMVQDINPGFASSDPAYLVDFNGTLFFRANDGVNGTEL